MGKKTRKVVPSANVEKPTPLFKELQRGVINVVGITPPQAGGNVTISLPVGAKTYQKIVVSNNIAEDKITEIQLLIDDKPVWEFNNATELRDLSKRYGEKLLPATGANSAMTFNFERLHLDELRERKALGLGTIGLQKVEIRFKIDSSVSNPEVSALAYWGAGSTLGLMRIIRKVSYNSAVSGELEIINPFLVNKVNQAKVMAVHLLRNDITKVKVVRGSSSYKEVTKASNDNDLLCSNRVPDDKVFMIDFCEENTIGGSLSYSDTNESFITIKPTVPSAGACNMLVEYVGTLGSA